MVIIAKVLISLALTIALLVIGFALGYPVGKHEGFESGSEWALIQAKLAAREAGVQMPVYLEDGLFHVVINRSQDGQGRAKQQEARCEDVKEAANGPIAEKAVQAAYAADRPTVAITASEEAPASAGEQTPDIW